MSARKVFLLGQTGSGKSFMGNQILGNDKAFVPAPVGDPNSFTTTIHSSQSTYGGCHLYVFDTPGLGDTKGRSIKFLDDIMSRIKQEKPHGLIFFINGGEKITPFVNFALRCFAQCLKTSTDSTLGMPHGRVLLVVNKLPRNAAYNSIFNPTKMSDDQIQKALAATIDQSNDTLTQNLEAPLKLPCAHTFGFQDGDEVNIKHTIAAIVTAIRNLPAEPLDVGQFRTFADVMKEANDLVSDKTNATEYAQRKIEQLKYDISWHERRIRDCTIANLCTCWVPFTNVATTIGFGAAIADSSCQIPSLTRELAAVEKNKEQVLEVAKANATKWLQEMTRLEKSMSSTK